MELSALGCDNDVQLRRLISFCRDLFGDSYPAEKVYDPQFWKTHIGHRFTSIVGSCADELVAHLALQPDVSAPSQVQLAYPIFDPKQPRQFKTFAAGLNALIERQAKLQQWELAYCFAAAALPGFPAVLNSAMGLIETAICPNYLPAATAAPSLVGEDALDLISRRSSVLIMQRFFGQAESDVLELYVPQAHREMVRYLYQPLRLQRRITGGNRRGGTLAIAADAPAIEKRVFKSFGVALAFIEPSLISSTTKLLTVTAAEQVAGSYLFVNMQDPACPSFCADLEQLGYCFGGVLPLLRGRDSILYFRERVPEINAKAFRSRRAQKLAAYVGQQLQNFSRRPPALGTAFAASVLRSR